MITQSRRDDRIDTLVSRPFGTHTLLEAQPSVETLGYSRTSLRDCGISVMVALNLMHLRWAIILDRNSQVAFHKLMIKAGVEKVALYSLMHGARVNNQLDASTP